MEEAKTSPEERRVHHGGEDSIDLITAFRCAREGIAYGFKTQRNLRIHLVFAIIAIILGFLLRINGPSWFAIVLCIALVFALEMVNTAIEAVVDLVSPEWHEKAKNAKDCSAGAVYIAAVASIVVALIIYVPALLRLLDILS